MIIVFLGAYNEQSGSKRALINERMIRMKTLWLKKDTTITEGMQSYLDKRAERLDKYTNDPSIQMKVSITLHGVRPSRLANLSVKGVFTYASQTIVVTEQNSDYYEAVDDMIDKMIRKIIAIQTEKREAVLRFSKERDEYDTPSYSEEENADIFQKRKNFVLKPMDEEEALLQMKALGHKFFLFKTPEDVTQLIYIRKDGTYGIIGVA